MTRETMVKEVMELVERFEYQSGLNYAPTEFGINAMLDVWQENKGDIISAMEHDPHYNGRYQVVLNHNFAREIDRKEVESFVNWMLKKMALGLNGTTVEINTDNDPYSFTTLDMRKRNGEKVTLDISEITTDARSVWIRFDDSYYYAIDMLVLPEGKLPIRTEQVSALRSAMNQYVTEDERARLNEAFPFLKLHAGAKTSRAIRRICKEYGIDKDPEFNGRYSRFADAINPLNVTRWTVLSVHPNDYFTMSFGNSWTSCHSIDKTNLLGIFNGQYHGCYSSGTLSYMLDKVSIVVYVVDASYKGDHFELEPKILRQMFHIDEEKIIQGRLYPQDNDSGAEETYKQLREIVQRVVSGWFGWDNLWVNKKGKKACCEVIRSVGDHYRDYECYDNCNVSYMKGNENHTKITIGHISICPTCGNMFNDEEYIICPDCRENVRKCERCGEPVSEDDYEAIWIGDYAYCCPDCAEADGYVYCSDGEWRSRYDSDVMFDDWTGEWEYDRCGYWEDAITTEDGSRFCCEENARLAGYAETYNGYWYPTDEVCYCEECDRCVHESEWNIEYDCCYGCAAKRERESEVTA